MPAAKPGFLAQSFLLLAAARALSAVFIPIADCDETYNYWEPAHFLTYGSGKQTWEYAPEFALRSWLLVWIYTWPGYLVTHAVAFASSVAPSAAPALNAIFTKIFVYYFSRIVAGAISACFETYFIGGVVARFGDRIARISLLLLCSCAGFANSSTSFLPSTFAMYAAFVAGGAVLRLEAARLDAGELADALENNKERTSSIVSASPQKTNNNNSSPASATTTSPTSTSISLLSNTIKACQVEIQRNSLRCVWSAVIGAVLGWPFAALSMVPFALLVLLVCRPFFVFPAREAAAALIASSISVSILDSVYYCKRDTGVFSTWNLVRYNVFSGGEGKGPELYGVEPWDFFFKNLFLNFNLIFPLALVSIACSALSILLEFVGFPNNIVANSAELAEKNDKSNSRKVSKFGRAIRSRHFSNLVLSAPFVLWFVFWMRVPHKEERFMVPVYPFIILPAAFLLGTVWTHSESGSSSSSSSSNSRKEKTISSNNNGGKNVSPSSFGHRLLKLLCTSFLSLTILLNISRSLALWRYYGDSDRAASFLYSHIEQQRTLNGDTRNKTICVGKDWYRMAPSYFAPENTRIKFVESRSFTGALPREFSEASENPTCTTTGPMNDLNVAAQGQSILLKDVADRCDYIFDTTLGDSGEELKNAAIVGGDNNKKQYKVLRVGQILDASASPWYARILYIPVWSDKFATWAQVVVASLN